MNKNNFSDIVKIVAIIVVVFLICALGIWWLQQQHSSITTPKTIQNSTKKTFGSYSCTSDCSGHEAGYAWGERYQICDLDYSNGKSESFNEGVHQWTEDNADVCGDSEESDYDSGDGDYY